MELLEFIRREAEAQAKAQNGETVSLPTSTTWEPIGEKEAENQFALAQMMIPQNMLQRQAGIPEHLRDAIRWAEAEKDKRGMN